MSATPAPDTITTLARLDIADPRWRWTCSARGGYFLIQHMLPSSIHGVFEESSEGERGPSYELTLSLSYLENKTCDPSVYTGVEGKQQCEALGVAKPRLVVREDDPLPEHWAALVMPTAIVINNPSNAMRHALLGAEVDGSLPRKKQKGKKGAEAKKPETVASAVRVWSNINHSTQAEVVTDAGKRKQVSGGAETKEDTAAELKRVSLVSSYKMNRSLAWISTCLTTTELQALDHETAQPLSFGFPRSLQSLGKGCLSFKTTDTGVLEVRV